MNVAFFGPRFSYCCFLLLLSIKIDAVDFLFKATKTLNKSAIITINAHQETV